MHIQCGIKVDKTKQKLLPFKFVLTKKAGSTLKMLKYSGIVNTLYLINGRL